MFQILPPAPVRISIDAGKPSVVVPRELFGVFFEEINHAGEGGIDSELIQNRSLAGPLQEKSGLPPGWQTEKFSGDTKRFELEPDPWDRAFWGNAVADLATLDNEGPNDIGQGRSVTLRSLYKAQRIALTNEGFWGIPLHKGARYRLVLWVRSDVPLTAALTPAFSLDEKDHYGGRSITARVPATANRWKRIGISLTAASDTPVANLMLSPNGVGTVHLAYASLKPEKSWEGHGLRPDLAERVNAMRPGFFRFPGGCYIEGNNLETNAWNWKATLRSPENRYGTNKTYWGYPSSNSLGFHEYLQFCEDLGARAMYVANAGLSHSDMATLDGTGPGSMDRYVQDALDAIEYANGSAKSKWGAMRAKAGHPKPFGLKYIEVGNEAGYDWSFGGPAAYAPRFRRIAEAIRAKYPGIVVIANNPLRDGGPQSYDLVSEHYYESPAWFWRNAARYDKYERKGPGIYVGEYAVTKGAGRGNLAGALGEAAFMTGMERNADVVRMASYAPLLENVNARQWNPNAIVFNNHESYGTPSYWVQTMFAQNRIARVVDSRAEASSVWPAEVPEQDFGMMTWNTQAEFSDITFQVTSRSTRDGGVPKPTGTWTVVDGITTQSDLGENRRYFLADETHVGVLNARIELRARKIAGKEGFIILAGGSNETDQLQWNLGGWGNTRHAFQYGGEELPGSIPLTDATRIETGRWYDIRVEREGNRIKGYLDGKLIQEATIPNSSDLATIAGRAENGDLLVRVINGSEQSRDAEIAVNGFRPRSGTATVLQGTLDSENSFEAPERVAPRAATLKAVGPRFHYFAPPHSLSILRLKR